MAVTGLNRPDFRAISDVRKRHPRALPGYLRAGFLPLRRVDETWDVPTRLRLAVPRHLLA